MVGTVEAMESCSVLSSGVFAMHVWQVIVLNPWLRKSKHYLRHRTHVQVVPFDVYVHYIPKRTK